MLRAIETRYLGPTNIKGGRVKAIARKREADMPELSLTDAWAGGHGIEENHCRVAKLLAAKMGWSGLYVGGSTDAGYCYVNAGDNVTLVQRTYGEGYRPNNGVEGRDWFYLAPAERS